MSATINRRSMLRGLATATAVTAISTAATASPNADAEIFALAAEYAEAVDAAKWAADAVEWIVAEYRHLWPLAPEELLGGANAETSFNVGHVAERDIAGRYLLRDKASLTKRLSRKFREEGGRTCFYLDTSERMAERLALWEAYRPAGRNPTKLARDEKRRRKAIKDYRQRLELARAYEAETSRLRSLSGIERANAHLQECRARVEDITDRIINAPVTTPEGLAIKARTGLATAFVQHVGKSVGLSPEMRFAAIIARDVMAIYAPISAN